MHDALNALLEALACRNADLEAWLSSILGGEVRVERAVRLGESSRETPWRLDLRSDQAEAVVLRYGDGCSANEAVALQAMEDHPLPTPRLIAWDPDGHSLGVPLFACTYIQGDALLVPMTAGEPWAEELYIETACTLQSIRMEELSMADDDALEVSESAADVLDQAYAAYENPDSLIHAAYRKLKETQPKLPGIRFSNGDLWPENLLVCDRRLSGVIDWQHAGFSDPFFEFLLPFFLVPALRDRGIEERYCRRMGFPVDMLHWYHGLEFFDSLRWVLKTGKPYEIHTAESLREDLRQWLKRT